MNKLVDKMGRWNGNSLWDNGQTLIHPYGIVFFDEEFEHTYNDMDGHKYNVARNLANTITDYEKDLECPTVEKIKENIKALCGRKRSMRVLYCFGKDLPVVNVRYMLDIIDCLNVSEIKYIDCKHPVLLIGEYGKCLLMPVAKAYMDEKGYKVVG